MEATLTIFQNGEAYYTSWISQTRDTNLHRTDQSLQSAICLAGVIRCDAQKSALLHQQFDAAIRVLTLNQAQSIPPISHNSPADSTNALSSLGWLLFNQLIPAPIQQQIRTLESGSTLQIVTNDADFPWELLHDGDDFLALKHVAARLPILVQAQSTHKLPRPNAKASCLLLCNPTGDLPGAEAEIAIIEDTLYAARDRVRYLTLYGANISAIQWQNMLAAQEYDLIHYAGHATPDALHLADGRFRIEEIRTALPNHPIVVLNACATARTHAEANMTDITRGAQTLAAAFIEAGAPAVIGMLWPVPDETSRRFAQVLYGHLVNGHTVGQALWQSRLEMRQRDPNGIGWMAPVLYGNPAWQLTPLAPRRAAGTVLAIRLAPSTAGAYAHADLTHMTTLMCAEIGKHGGVILSANQTELLAVFGLYTINDLNTVQAVQAARSVIALAAGWEMQLPAAALASGNLTVTTSPQDNEAIRPAAPILMGDAVVEVQRLIGAAMPGQLLLNQRSYDRVKERFNFRPWSENQADDTADAAYELTSTAVNISPQTPALNMTATVGRAAELQRLLDAWEQVQHGHGRALGIRGEAGIGKTHLVQAFKEQAQTAETQWVQVACSLNVQNTPYGLLLRLMQALLALPEHAEPAQINAALDAHFANQPAANIAMLAELLGVQPSATIRQEQSVYQHQLYQLLAHLLVQRMENGPIVLVLEDAHWSDPASLDVLATLAGQLEEAAILLLLIHRTTWQSPWHGRDFFQSIHLRPLEPTARQQLCLSLLQTAELPAELVSMLEKTSGNPFFLHEILLTLMQKGLLTQSADADRDWRLSGALEARDVPDSIQLVIDMRLERLDSGARQVLNMAAVLGTNILPELLQGGLAMGDDELLTNLRTLTEKDFLRRPFGSRTYEFRHDLIRDVAYMKIPVAQRQIWHRQAALALEETDSERREAIALLAHHYYLSLAESDDDPPTLNPKSDPALIEKCLTYLIQSGQKALDGYGGREAVSLFQRAHLVQSLQPEEATRQAQIQASLGHAYRLTNDNEAAKQAYRTAQGALHTRPLITEKRQQAAQLARELARLHMWSAEYMEAEAWIETGLEHTRGCLEPTCRAAEAMLHIQTASIRINRGAYEEAIAPCKSGLAIAQANEDEETLAEGHFILGVIMRSTGKYDDSLSHYNICLDIYQRQQNLYQIYRTRMNIGLALLHRGQWPQALEHIEAVSAFWQQIGEENLLAGVYINSGVAEQHLGNYAQALDYFNRALRICQQIGNPAWTARAHANLGTLYRLMESWDLAESHLQHSLEILQNHAIEAFQSDVYAEWALVQLGQGEMAAAIEFGQQALKLAEAAHTQLDHAVALRSLGCVYLAGQDTNQALTHMRHSHQILDTIGETYEMARTQHFLAVAEAKSGNVDKAIQQCESAVHIFRTLNAKRDLEKAEFLHEQLTQQS